MLEVDDDTLNELKKKHPPPAKIDKEVPFQGPIKQVPHSYFDCIDEQQILKAAQLTKGAGGPSLLDGEKYRHILVSKKVQERRKTTERENGQASTKACHLGCRFYFSRSFRCLSSYST